MKGNLEVPVLTELAQSHHKTPAQIVLRWDLQNGVAVIPKTVHPERMAENAAIFDFELSPAEMEEIDGLNEDRHFGPNPDTTQFGESGELLRREGK